MTRLPDDPGEPFVKHDGHAGGTVFAAGRRAPPVPRPGVETLIADAIEASDDPEVRYHLREAWQLHIAAREGDV